MNENEMMKWWNDEWNDEMMKWWNDEMMKWWNGVMMKWWMKIKCLSDEWKWDDEWNHEMMNEMMKCWNDEMIDENEMIKW